MNDKLKHLAHALPFAILAACVDDPEIPVLIDDEPEQEVAQVGDPNSPEEIVHLERTPYLFGSTVVAGGPGNKTTYMSEDASEYTCFLRGIAGSLEGRSSTWGDPRVDAVVSVEIDSATNRYKVRTKAGYGPGVWAHVSCVRSTSRRLFLSKTAEGLGTSASVRPNRRCFLTGITAHGSAMTGPRPNDEMPGVKVWDYGGSWRINTWFSDNGDFSNDGSATAVCFDISGLGETGQHGVVNGDLVIFDWGNYNDWYCGAEGIFGWFDGGQFTGAWSYKSAPRWRAKATAGHGLTSRCYY